MLARCLRCGNEFLQKTWERTCGCKVYIKKAKFKVKSY